MSENFHQKSQSNENERKNSFKKEEIIISNGIKPSIFKQAGVYFTIDSESKSEFTHHKLRLNDGEKISGKPIQLIISENGVLSLNKTALEIIRNLQGPIAVCSVVGPYRTGKSFILNLLLNRPDGFVLGSELDSCTRGIWMWDTPIKHKNKHGEFNLILLDTEGLESFDTTPELDNMIFVLGILLSSFFVYNTKNVIDREAVRKLGIISDLSKHIKDTSSDQINQNRVKLDSPDFIWVVRDVFLTNKSNSTKKYLNTSIKLETSDNQANFITESIKSSFKSFDCLLLPKPIDHGIGGQNMDETLRNMQDVKWCDLRIDFKILITGLCYKILSNITPKTLLGNAMSAPMFAGYIESVVKQLNENQHVKLVDSLTASIEYASEKFFDDAKEMYDGAIKKFREKNPYPVEWKLLENTCDEIYKKCLNILEKNLSNRNEYKEKYMEKFLNTINEGKCLLREENSKEIIMFFKDKLNSMWNEALQKQKTSGNLELEFVNSYNRLLTSYNLETRFSSSKEKKLAFDEWYKEKDVDQEKERIKKKSDEIKTRIGNEQKALEEKSIKDRVLQDHGNAISQLANQKAANDAYLRQIIKSQEETIKQLEAQNQCRMSKKKFLR